MCLRVDSAALEQCRMQSTMLESRHYAAPNESNQAMFCITQPKKFM